MTQKDFERMSEAVAFVKEGAMSLDDLEEKILIPILSSDERVVVSLLLLLQAERNSKKELLNDLNLELSRAHIHLENPSLRKENIPFVLSEIEKFYKKWGGKIRHCFNRFND